MATARNPQEDIELQAEQMRLRFDELARHAVQGRATNVKHDGILDGVGDLFEEEFTLDDDEEEEEEFVHPLLLRTRMPDDVIIEAVHVGEESHTKGTVEIEVSSLGLVEPVTFYVRTDEGDYYTVVWDPITGGSHLDEGKVL